MKNRTFLLFAAVVLFASAAQAQRYQMSHFKFWKVEESPFTKRVRLQGQFDKTPWGAAVTSIAFFGNPVTKNEEPIPDKLTRFIAYRLTSAQQPHRVVTIANQFSKEARLFLGDPALLLVPAMLAKAERPPAPGLDHFVCYVVRDDGTISRDVTLEDAFDAQQKEIERVGRLHPVFFCVPVSKNGEGIPNRRSHLTLYAFTPRTFLKPPIGVIARDQFGTHKLTAVESVLLAVPSDKLEWKEIP